MNIFFEKCRRDGVSYISNRYSKASKKYLKSYDQKQELKHIIYLDANKLYGYAMPSFFATSGFKWIDHKKFDLNKYNNNNMVVSSKLILNILTSYKNCKMIIH